MKARRSAKRMFWVAAGTLAVCLSGCVDGSGVIVSDVELPEEANKGEMTVADLVANGEYEAAERLWRSVTRRRMYVTGAIGSSPSR